MKTTYLLITLLGILIAMSGCGNTVNGFNKSNTTVPTEENSEKIQIETKCTTPLVLSTYVELQSGDTLINDEENTSVTLYHDENNEKLVCLNSGKAHIKRAITQ